MDVVANLPPRNLFLAFFILINSLYPDSLFSNWRRSVFSWRQISWLRYIKYNSYFGSLWKKKATEA
jgi:hypothetical protein